LKTLETLETTFAGILEASQNDTRMRDAIYAGFDDLTMQFNLDKATATSKLEDANATRKLHMDCRVQESTLFALHNESEHQLKISLVAEKDMLKIAQQKHDAVTLRFQELVESGLDDLSLEGHAKHLELVTEYQEVMASYKAALQTYHTRLSESGNSTEAYTEKKSACDQKQGAFEDSVCEAGESSQTSCNAYMTGYSARLQDYNVVTGNVAARASDRQAEWTHLKRVACVLEKLASVATDGDLAANSTLGQDIQDCYANDFSEEALTVAEKLAPAPQECLPVPIWPCTEAFAQEEYVDMPSGTSAAACESACSAMPTPSPTPAPRILRRCSPPTRRSATSIFPSTTLVLMAESP